MARSSPPTAATYARRRWAAFGALVAVLAVVAYTCSGPAPVPQRPGATPARKDAASTTSQTVPAVEAQDASWKLPSPLSRTAVVAQGSDLVILGGRTASGSPARGVFRLDPNSGAIEHLGDLTRPVYDAGAAVIGGTLTLFGGSSPEPVASVESFGRGSATTTPLATGPAPSTATGSVPSTATGIMPEPRSGMGTVTIGATTYLVGGYDGVRLVPDVLATSDGVRFRVVAHLPVPVLHPAVVALGHQIWVFGGETGSSAVSTIQEVDTSGRARIVGRLPEPLSLAVAADLDGHLYVIGGRSGSRVSAAVWSVDTPSGAVHAAGLLPRPLSAPGAGVVGGTLFLLGGDSAQPQSGVVSVRVAAGARPGARGR